MAKLILKGWRALKDLLSPSRFEHRLKAEVKKATMKNALMAEGAIKSAITEGKYAPNSKLTEMIKGSNRPLVDTGELLKSITGRALTWNTAAIGVLKSRAVRDASTGRTRDLLSVASILHNGATITVTKKMRLFFFRMADLYRKGEIKQAWVPLKAGTKVLVIPPRPFLEAAVDQRMLDIYERNWNDAVQRAMAGGR